MAAPQLTEILLKDGQFVRRTITEQDLGSQETILAQCAATTKTFLKNLTIDADGRPWHLLHSKTEMALIAELNFLPFNTYFEVAEDDATKLCPVFRPHPGALKLDAPWPVPTKFARMLFVLRYKETRPGAILPFLPSDAYLFAYRDGELRHFPYPNLFGDGRICMGGTWDNRRSRAVSIFDDFQHALTSFHETQMNDHLISNLSFRFFRKDLNGNWLAPEEALYTGAALSRQFPICGVTFMEGFRP